MRIGIFRMLQLGFRSSRARTIASSPCVVMCCTRGNHLASLGVKQREPSTSMLTEIFQAEKKKRARELNKLVVKAKEAPDSTYKSFLMNQDVSTAFDVAKHISHHVSTSSALCVQKKTDGSSKICSLNEPLHEECDIDFIQFDTTNKEFERHVHEVFFRSSSILLGAIAGEAFNQVTGVRKHTAKLNDSYFSIHASTQSIKSSWMASQAELGQLSSFAFEKFIRHSIPFEVLQLSLESLKDTKMDMRDFVDKSGNVKLCRVGDYVAPIDGPVITHTGQIGRFAVVQAVQKEKNLRLCGMSIPRSSQVSSYIWNILLEHSQKKANE